MTAQETRDRAGKGGWGQAWGRDPPAKPSAPLAPGAAGGEMAKWARGQLWDREWPWNGDQLCDGDWPWDGDPNFPGWRNMFFPGLFLRLFLAECPSLAARSPLGSLWLWLFCREGSEVPGRALAWAGGRQGANYGMLYFLSCQLGKVLPAARLCLCFFGVPRDTLTHTHMHSGTLTHSHTLGHTHTHSHTLSHTLTHTHTHSGTLSHTLGHTLIHSRTLTHIHTHSGALSHTHAYSLTLMHSLTRALGEWCWRGGQPLAALGGSRGTRPHQLEPFKALVCPHGSGGAGTRGHCEVSGTAQAGLWGQAGGRAGDGVRSRGQAEWMTGKARGDSWAQPSCWGELGIALGTGRGEDWKRGGVDRAWTWHPEAGGMDEGDSSEGWGQPWAGSGYGRACRTQPCGRGGCSSFQARTAPCPATPPLSTPPVAPYRRAAGSRGPRGGAGAEP